jgi:ribokinase
LHTRVGAAWSNGRETAIAHTIKAEATTLTGAGDSWDAADIIGHLAGFDTTERLIFSNACASFYIKNPYTEPVSVNDAFKLLERIEV